MIRVPAVKKIASPEALEKLIQGFVNHCEITGEIPDDYNLCKFLDISIPTLDRYYMGKDSYKGFDSPLKSLVAYREHRELKRAEEDPRQITGSIFRLKQKRWGGYTDRQDVSLDIAPVVFADDFPDA